MQMVGPDLVLRDVPSSLVLMDGRTVQGDISVEQAQQAGWLLPMHPPAAAEGWDRTWQVPAWRDNGDGTAAPCFVDVSPEQLAAIDAERQASISATVQAAQDAAETHNAVVAKLREQYKQITRTICQLAGVAVVDKFANVNGVADVILQYGEGENELRLTKYALFLKATLDELRRVDGDDAWERV